MGGTVGRVKSDAHRGEGSVPRHGDQEARRGGVLLAAAGLIAPGPVATSVSEIDFVRELARNHQLRTAPPERQGEQRQELRHVTEWRLRHLRRVLVTSFAWMASAAALAMVVATWGVIPHDAMRAISAFVSVFCFAWATLGRLGWPGQSIKGDTTVERLDETIFRLLYWFGMFFGTFAAT